MSAPVAAPVMPTRAELLADLVARRATLRQMAAYLPVAMAATQAACDLAVQDWGDPSFGRLDTAAHALRCQRDAVHTELGHLADEIALLSGSLHAVGVAPCPTP